MCSPTRETPQSVTSGTNTSHTPNSALYLNNEKLFVRKPLHRFYNNYNNNIVRTKNTRKSIQSFFEQDENSVFAPGSRDFIKKNKLRKRKRYLTDTVENLYKKYCTLSDSKISRTNFFRLKPFWIVPRKISSRDTCLCKHHANFRLLTDRLHLLKIVKFKTTDEFRKFACCDTTNKECMFRECDRCANTNVTCSNNLLEEKTWYNQWVTEKVERVGAKGANYKVQITFKKKFQCTVSQLIDLLNSKISVYLKHVFTNHANHVSAKYSG